METAVNLVQDGAPVFGERVLVFGQGIIGLLTASLLTEFPLDALVSADCYALRCNSSPVSSGFSLDPYAPGFRKAAMQLLKQGADLTFELSGNPTALNDAIALTAYSGRIVIGSWYGEKQVEVKLGGTFHRSRIKLISSQVSTIAPELEGRWNKARRFETAWKALKRIKPEKWITHRFAIDDAEKAYKLLDENPPDTIQVIFDYRP
jgi:threonine dehydrogenase-like Zn-dependent dehydrogenase